MFLPWDARIGGVRFRLAAKMAPALVAALESAADLRVAKNTASLD